MDHVRTNLPRAVRAIRQQLRLRQSDVAERSGVSRATISRIERGYLDGLALRSVQRVSAALDVSLELRAHWRGAMLDRLLDARHASLQDRVATLLDGLGYLVRPEVSFSHYGDRGRVDLLALHLVRRLLLIVEIKTEIGDLQDTLGRLDVKARLGTVIAREVGWLSVSDVVPALVVLDSRAARRAVGTHPALFARLTLRGRRAIAWLRRPVGDPPTGLLWFATGPDARVVSANSPNRVRKRPNAQSA
jgi:transcriptional regulator with XRE-family HTH domain